MTKQDPWAGVAELKPCPTCSGKGMIKFMPKRYTWTLEDVEEVLNQAVRNFGLPKGDIIGRTRRPDVVQARDWVVKELYLRGMTLKEVGFHLGGRDHSTIIHSLRKFGIGKHSSAAAF